MANLTQTFCTNKAISISHLIAHIIMCFVISVVKLSPVPPGYSPDESALKYI